MNDPVVWTVVSIPVVVILYLWVAAGLSAIFRKVGEEEWRAWVPVLNAIVLFRLGGMSAWFLLLGLVPIVGTLALLAVFAVVAYRVNRSFGAGIGMTVLAVLLVPVWTSILGWGPARWLGEHGEPHSGPVRRGEPDALDARVAGPTRPAGQPAYSPMYSPDPFVPPRPPAPPVLPAAPAFPTAPSLPPASVAPGYGASTAPLSRRSGYQGTPDDAPADPWSFAPPPVVEPESGPPRRRAFRSTAIGVNPVFDDLDDDGTGGSRSAPPSPVSSVPGLGRAAASADPWAPPVIEPITPPAAPLRRSSWAANADGHFDTSAEVSAVVGAPALGEPLAARGSVSAQHNEAEIPDAGAAFDETIVVARRRPSWVLTPPLGAPIAVTSDALIVGRRPSADPDFPDAQLVPISDETRTMSKTHARLELQGEQWLIVDLDSTNGVIIYREDGSESEATPGVPERVGERFLLGDAELRLARSEGR
ncbi:MAG TPA: DUF5684 domain-containing protein [Microbacterium sp.]|uniref:DUF5684 domain-containing protein n=1 Tax=Microbacterium sp. TaxID=51671 RepID=UPI002CF04CC0|nr:DUF5684 domain-containing protein [Microbacterium sp.]HWI31299.1 DUF5684 domain-containing protein [Microbacterium sp.]